MSEAVAFVERTTPVPPGRDPRWHDRSVKLDALEPLAMNEDEYIATFAWVALTPHDPEHREMLAHANGVFRAKFRRALATFRAQHGAAIADYLKPDVRSPAEYLALSPEERSAYWTYATDAEKRQMSPAITAYAKAKKRADAQPVPPLKNLGYWTARIVIYALTPVIVVVMLALGLTVIGIVVAWVIGISWASLNERVRERHDDLRGLEHSTTWLMILMQVGNTDQRVPAYGLQDPYYRDPNTMTEAHAEGRIDTLR